MLCIKGKIFILLSSPKRFSHDEQLIFLRNSQPRTRCVQLQGEECGNQNYFQNQIFSDVLKGADTGLGFHPVRG